MNFTVQCEGITKKGSRCKKKISSDTEKFCYLHKKSTNISDTNINKSININLPNKSTAISDTNINKSIEITDYTICIGITNKNIKCKKIGSMIYNQITNQFETYCYLHKNINPMKIIDFKSEPIQNQILLDKKYFDCNCCLSETEITNKICCTKNLDHSICNICFVNWITEKVVSGNSKISCMVDEKCDSEYNNLYFSKFLNSKLYKLYYEKQLY